MLVRLFGRNFRSLRNEFELSFVAADLKRKEDRERGVLEVSIKGEDEPLRLLKTVAIYGANASGKSTVLLAARALRWLGAESSPRTEPDADIAPYEPFLLDARQRKGPILLGCDVYFDRAILRYELEFNKKAILRERMAILEGASQQILIDRRPAKDVEGDLIERGSANRLYVEKMQPNISVLSKLAQHGPKEGDESVRPYYDAIRNSTHYADYSAAAVTFAAGAGRERFADDAAYRDWIMSHLIRSADVGIRDVRIRRENLDFPADLRDSLLKLNSNLKFPYQQVLISFVHEGKSRQPIDYSDESSGTKKLFNLAADWWILANQSVSTFIDELGASLHPRLLDRLIRSINDEGSHRAQLVFATHDTGLLEAQDGLPPALRRDQVYFTRKNMQGETELYSLVEFKETARPVHNLRKRYMSGLYGAIPDVERFYL